MLNDLGLRQQTLIPSATFFKRSFSELNTIFMLGKRLRKRPTVASNKSDPIVGKIKLLTYSGPPTIGCSKLECETARNCKQRRTRCVSQWLVNDLGPLAMTFLPLLTASAGALSVSANLALSLDIRNSLTLQCHTFRAEALDLRIGQSGNRYVAQMGTE